MRNFGRENGNLFQINVIQKSWSAKKFSVPPNSAPGLRHWARGSNLFIL